MDTDQIILDARHRLGESVGAFNARWTESAHHARTYALPLYEGGLVPELIPVRAGLGAEASAAAAAALGRFERAPEQLPTTSWRLPGVVFCIDDLEEDLRGINDTKDRLRKMVREAEPKEDERRKLVRRLFPGESVLQIYRHAHIASAEVVRVGFTWSPTTSSSSTMTVVQAGRLVEEQLAHGDFADADRRRSFEMAWRELGRLDHGRCRIIRRRVVAPHPRVSLFEGFGRGARKKMHHANLPVFVFGRDTLPVSPLKDFDVTRRRPERSDRKALVRLLDGMHLFVDHGARTGEGRK